MSNLNNVGMMHKSCGDDRIKQFQLQNPDLKLVGQQHVKLKFTEAEQSEWMWVLITQYDDDTKKATGVLDNDPVFLQNYEYNDVINFTYDSIAAILEK